MTILSYRVDNKNLLDKGRPRDICSETGLLQSLRLKMSNLGHRRFLVPLNTVPRET